MTGTRSVCIHEHGSGFSREDLRGGDGSLVCRGEVNVSLPVVILVREVRRRWSRSGPYSWFCVGPPEIFSSFFIK